MKFSCEKIVAPFAVPVKTARGTFPRRESLVVKISRGNESACGECAPWDGFGGETLADAEMFLAAQRGNVPEKIPAALPCLAHAFSAARFFLENPELKNPPPPPRAACAKLLPRSREDSVETVLEKLARERADGYSVFKIKIGLDAPDAELAFCEKFLRGAPAGTRIRFDANGAFSTGVLPAFVALAAAPALEFFEQPLPPSRENDREVFAAAEKTGGKFALDESVREPWAFPRDTPAVAVVKPLLVGDFPRLLAWLEKPQDADVVVSTVFENSAAGRDALCLACSRLAANRRRAFGLG